MSELCTGYYGVDELVVMANLTGSWVDQTDHAVRSLTTIESGDTMTLSWCGGWLLIDRITGNAPEYGLAEYCLESICTQFSNVGTGIIPLGIRAQDPSTVTFTLLSGTISISSVTVIGSEPAEPVVVYVPVVATPHVQNTQIVKVNDLEFVYSRQATTGDILVTALILALITMSLMKMVIEWKR